MDSTPNLEAARVAVNRLTLDELNILLADIPSLNQTSQLIAQLKPAQAGSLICRAINFIDAIQRRQQLSQAERYALFPIVDEELWRIYKLQDISHWSADEVEYVRDKKDYESSSPEEQRLMEGVNAFFLIGDGAISMGMIHRMLLECETYEETLSLITQLRMETIHAEAYGLAAYTMLGEIRFREVMKQASESEYVKRKVAFIEKYTQADIPKALRYVAQACAEGIFFCELFAVVFWWRSRGKFANFIFLNELISRDESQHRTQMAKLALRAMASWQARGDREVSPAEILAVVQEAVEIEKLFVGHGLLDEDIDDLSSVGLSTYCCSIADNLLVELGQPTHWGATNPFTWLNDISMSQKANFYEVRVGAYSRTSFKQAVDWRGRAGLTVRDTEMPYSTPEQVDF